MPDSSKLKPKDRILQSAIKLFAARGFSRVGMRDLAEAAQVSLSMINYHFGSKAGVLKAINDFFFSRYIQNAQEILSTDVPIEIRFRRLIDRQVRFFRSNPELMIIALTEFPYTVPDVAAQKAEYASVMIQNFRNELARQLPRCCGGAFPVEIIGPVLLGMMAMHFIIRPVLRGLDTVCLDDAYYERYIEIIKQIFLYGIVGMSEKPLPNSDGGSS